MGPGHIYRSPRVTLGPQRLGSLRALREWRWNADRRRQVSQLGDLDRRHPFDNGYVGDAMARQIEEIRNLPEVGH